MEEGIYKYLEVMMITQKSKKSLIITIPREFIKVKKKSLYIHVISSFSIYPSNKPNIYIYIYIY